MYSRLFPTGRVDPAIFDIIFRHHVRKCGLTLDEYADKKGHPTHYVYALASGRSRPTNTILDDMGMKYTPTSEGYYEDL